jgi:hypothetical protein
MPDDHEYMMNPGIVRIQTRREEENYPQITQIFADWRENLVYCLVGTAGMDWMANENGFVLA